MLVVVVVPDRFDLRHVTYVVTLTATGVVLWFGKPFNTFFVMVSQGFCCVDFLMRRVSAKCRT